MTTPTTDINPATSKMPFGFQKLDWPAAEGALESLRKKQPRTLIHGVPGSAKAFLLAWFYEKLQEPHPWLVVTPTREEALILQDDLSAWLPHVPVYLCPSWETLPQDVETPDPELIGERQRAFYELLNFAKFPRPLGERDRVRGVTSEKSPSPRPSPLQGEGEKHEKDFLAKVEELSQAGPSGPSGKAFIVLSPLLGALQYTLPPDEWLDQVLNLKRGQEAPSDLKQRLVAMGYEPANQVVRLGQFAMRGGILDLASPGSPSGPVRLEFFGDTLESVRPLDILNQRSSGNLEEVYIFPAHEIVLKDETRYNLRQALKNKTKDESNATALRWAQDALELFNQTFQFPGWQWNAVGALEKRACLFDYLPKQTRIFLVEPLAFERKWEDFQEVLVGCNRRAQEDGSFLFDSEELFSDIRFLKKALESGQAMALAQINQDLFQKPPDFSHAVPGRSLTPYYGKFATFASDLRKWLKEKSPSPRPSPLKGEGELQTPTSQSFPLEGEGVTQKPSPLGRGFEGTQGPLPVNAVGEMGTLIPPNEKRAKPVNGNEGDPVLPSGPKAPLIEEQGRVRGAFSFDEGNLPKTQVIIWCHNKGERERLSELLKEEGIPPKDNPQLSLPLGEIEQSFAFEDIGLFVLPDHDLFRRYRGGRRRQRVRAVAGGKPLSSLSEISIGDWTVHVDSGICLYRGLTPLTIDGVTRDYIQLEFADNEKIYLPTDQIALIQRYIGSEGSPVLTKLGGEQWSRAKAKVKREIEAIARELMALYSVRQTLKKKPASGDTPWQMEFEDSFLYELTPGQYGSVRDVKRDMESDRVMDRLVCGDVGYGKTEVAMRAAFKAVQDKRQVAVLVPTTILAQQHFNTFKERMAEYPVEVHLLSRFKSRAEIKQTLEAAREGKADIVIGTHRLLGKDVKFARLGLLVIDEEHRFGVAQKEKLKSLKHDVDVLTLTATPIPRTLHLSLSGIREISVIDTPPKNRRAVLVQVSPLDDRLVAEAVRREMNREGQVFYVHNHVKDIERIADRLHKMVPEAKLAVAHGQLSEHELESIMMDFVNKEYHVLVCTSIIESGLDMPNVNTLIVERSDAFGLAQLYQLKGRVGRTDRQAYAYFFYPRHVTLRELAQKRLEVLQEFSSLGSGMHVAMKDMEIRGAGNVLGVQQHGNMDSIGFDLYSRMLSQEIAHMKGEETAADFTPLLSLGITAYFPKEYIPDEALKIEFYRRLAEMSEEEQLGQIEEELKDRFGPLPTEAQMLLKIASLRPKVKKLGIQRLEVANGWVALQWHPDLTPPPEKVGKWMKQWPPTRIRFAPQDPNSISFRVMKVAGSPEPAHPNRGPQPVASAQGDEGPEKQMEAVQGLLNSLEKG